ncbi:MAG: hypothetical protein MJ193_00035 [Clostridia bacterium]|nr:hypothetical protein [Clostridia bacterium]
MPKGTKKNTVGTSDILNFVNQNENFVQQQNEEINEEINEVDELEEDEDFEIDFNNTELNLQLTDEDIKNLHKAAGKKPNIFEEYHEENKGNSVPEKEEKKDNKIHIKNEVPKAPDFLLEEDEDEEILKEASELKNAVKEGYIEEKEFDKEDKELLNKADDIELKQYKNADFDDVEDQSEKDKLVTSNLQKQTELLSKKVDRVVGESPSIKFRTEETIQSIQEKEDEILSKEKEDEILAEAQKIREKRAKEQQIEQENKKVLDDAERIRNERKAAEEQRIKDDQTIADAEKAQERIKQEDAAWADLRPNEKETVKQANAIREQRKNAGDNNNAVDEETKKQQDALIKEADVLLQRRQIFHETHDNRVLANAEEIKKAREQSDNHELSPEEKKKFDEDSKTLADAEKIMEKRAEAQAQKEREDKILSDAAKIKEEREKQEKQEEKEEKSEKKGFTSEEIKKKEDEEKTLAEAEKIQKEREYKAEINRLAQEKIDAETEQHKLQNEQREKDKVLIEEANKIKEARKAETQKTPEELQKEELKIAEEESILDRADQLNKQAQEKEQLEKDNPEDAQKNKELDEQERQREDEILKKADEIEKKRPKEVENNIEVNKDEVKKDEPKKEDSQKVNEGPQKGEQNQTEESLSSRTTKRIYDKNGMLLSETVEEKYVGKKPDNLDEMKVESKGEPENDEPDLDAPEVEEKQPNLNDMVKDFNKEHGTKYSAKNIDKYLKGKFDKCEGESLADQQKNFEKELTTFTKRAYQSMLNKKELQGKELTSLQLDDFNKFSKSLQQHCKENGLLSKDYKMKDFAGMTPKEIKDAQLEHLDKLPKNQQEKTNAILGQGRKGNIKTMDKLLNEQLDKVPPCNEGAGFDNINTKNALMSLQAAERLHNSRSRVNRFFHPINNRREKKMIENGLTKLEAKGYTKQEINQQLAKVDKNSDLVTQSYNEQKKEVDKMFEKNSQKFEKQRERERKAEEKKRGEKISVKEADIAKQELNSGTKSKKVELNKEKTMDKQGPQQGPKGK